MSWVEYVKDSKTSTPTTQEKKLVIDETINPDEESIEVRDEKELSSIKMLKLKGMKQRRGYKILVIGRPATGKTRFALTAPTPTLFMDTEYAVSAFSEVDFCDTSNVSVVNIFEVNEKTHEIDSIKMIKQVEETLSKLHKEYKNKYKTVVFDSVTSLWQYLQDWLRYEITRIGGKINIKGVPADRRDWGKANSKYYGIMQTLIAGDWNVIATAQSEPIYDERGQMVGYKASMQKKTEFYFDLVINLDKKVNANGDITYYGKILKCRYPIPGVEGKVIEFLDFNKLIAFLDEARKKYKENKKEVE